MLLLFLFLPCLISTNFVEGNVPKYNNSRIINGTEAPREKFSYVVSMQSQYDKSHICGGSILNKKYILTAAHCVRVPRYLYPEDVLVWVGGVDLREPWTGFDMDVAEIHVHNDYDKGTNENDIAILKLVGELGFSKDVNSIDLWIGAVQVKTPCVVSGWGRTNPSVPKGHPRLLYTDVEIVDHEKCKYNYEHAPSDASKITDKMVCANRPGRDSCKGDSGGPLVCHYMQVGVVSFGRGCGYRSYPGVYTEINSYKDWIRNIIKN